MHKTLRKLLTFAIPAIAVGVLFALGAAADSPSFWTLVGNRLAPVSNSYVVQLGNLASDPASGSNGQTYYNTTSGVRRCYDAGAWENCNASVTGIVPLANGGTGASLTASNGGIFYSTGSAGAVLSGTATSSRVLLSGSSAAPTWSTATYPTTSTANQLLYSSSANTVGGLATANSGVLVTSSGGVPSISGTLPSAVQGNITSLGTVASGTWQGSVIGSSYGGAGSVSGILKANGSGTVSAASAGTDYQVPLTFSTGLTNSSNTVTSNLVTGVSGGQTAIGGTGPTDSLSLQSTSGVGATGATIKFLVGNAGATQAMTILNSGSVGIGTASPTALLDVAGTAATGNGGSYTSAGLTANTLTGGTIAVRFRSASSPRYRSDWSIGSGGMGVNVYDDTGAAYLPFSYSALQTQINSISANGTGIFSFAGPTAGGNSYATLDSLRISGTDTGNTIYQSTGNMGITTGNGNINLGSGTSNLTVTQNSVVPFTSLGSGAVANTLYLKAGNVGIGTTTPTVFNSAANSLQVAGAIQAGSNIYSGSFRATSGGGGTQLANGNAAISLSIQATNDVEIANGNQVGYYMSGSAGTKTNGIGTISPTTTLTVQGTGSLGIFNVLTPGAANALYVANSGSVGIGTASPGTALQVVGTVTATAVANNAAQSVVNCSTSGTATFSEREQGASYKNVIVHEAACLGTASYTYPTAFTYTPDTLGADASTVTSVSATAATVTGSTTTGFSQLYGY
jgi:hypothetical protein